ncbi:MAG TPA: acyl carrier protein [Thermotogota bacterium]|nr:acyl carrier protein [Thermotogota bacterium]
MSPVLSIIAKILRVPETGIQPDDKMDSFGNYDSLAFLQIVAEMEEKLGVSIRMEEMKNITKIGDFLRYYQGADA